MYNWMNISELIESTQYLLHHMRVFHAGEAGVEALEFVGELGEIDAEEVEHGGMEVVDGGAIFNGVVAEFVG